MEQVSIKRVDEKSTKNADLAAKSNKAKKIYEQYETTGIGIALDNLDYSLSDFLSNEEEAALKEIVERLFKNGCRLEIAYYIKYKDSAK